MRKTGSIKWIELSLIMIVLSIHTSVSANSHLYLKANKTFLKPGNEFILEVNIENMDPVYEIEMELRFNPNTLEVIDSESERDGIQVKPGNFFDLTQNYFPLQNYSDNTDGSVKYALSLLNPAFPEDGEGSIIYIPFRAKSAGQADFHIKKIRFGTRNGKTILPSVESEYKIEVVNDKPLFPFFSILMVFIIFGSIVIIILCIQKKMNIGIWNNLKPILK